MGDPPLNLILIKTMPTDVPSGMAIRYNHAFDFFVMAQT